MGHSTVDGRDELEAELAAGWTTGLAADAITAACRAAALPIGLTTGLGEGAAAPAVASSSGV
eukprot:2334742-Prymnesium_polylepis.2